MRLTPRELATVLAALREWQESMEDEMFADWAKETCWFDEHEPLSPAEIADLCDRLNA